MKLKITVEDRTYEVEVEAFEPEASRPSMAVAHVRVPAVPVAPPARPPGGQPTGDASRVCRSPIGGTVVRVLAQEGQAIQVGDVLMVLEAMKMETNITAPVAAKVARLNAKVGEAVQGGQVLVEFA